MKRIHVSSNVAAAQALRARLEARGIPAECEPAEVAGTLGSILPAIPGLYEVSIVKDEDVEKAAQILQEFLQEISASSKRSAWECESCGERMEPQFVACWKCGREREGDSAPAVEEGSHADGRSPDTPRPLVQELPTSRRGRDFPREPWPSRFLLLARAARTLVRWLLNPLPLAAAIRSTYRRAFQLTLGLFLASALAGFLVGPRDLEQLSTGYPGELLSDTSKGPASPWFCGRLVQAIRREYKEREAAGARDTLYFERLLEALSKGGDEAKQANLDLNRWLEAQLGDDLTLDGLGGEAWTGSSVGRALVYMWLGILISMLFSSLLLVVLGFFLGVYPAITTVCFGIVVGTSFSPAAGAVADTTGMDWFFLPVWLAFLLAQWLSAAIGFDLATYVKQRYKGAWFKDHAYLALKTWWVAVVPLTLVAMLLLGGQLVLATLLDASS